MIYLTAQKVISPKAQTGVNAFRYAQTAVRSFELVEVEDPGVLEAQRLEVPPGGNEVICFLDVLAPDATEPQTVKRVLEMLRLAWEQGLREVVVQDEVHALFVPGRLPEDSIVADLERVTKGLVEVAQASPAPDARDARPIAIVVRSTDEGKSYALDEDSRRRVQLVRGALPRSVNVTHQNEHYAASRVFGDLYDELLGPLTGLDALRLQSEFGGVRFVDDPGGRTLWEWPVSDVRPGYCLSCHQHGTLREDGGESLICAYCGNLQSSDGLWVAALS